MEIKRVGSQPSAVPPSNYLTGSVRCRQRFLGIEAVRGRGGLGHRYTAEVDQAHWMAYPQQLRKGARILQINMLDQKRGTSATVTLRAARFRVFQRI
jgi:hypothetical protein